MGWVLLTLIGLMAFALLRVGGMPRTLTTLAAAALVLGAAGYALQQNAELRGHPVRTDARGIEVDPGLAAFRSEIMPGVADDQAILAAADNRLRSGDTAGAAQFILAAVERRPTAAALWTGLGSALSAHDGGQVSPAAELAFRRAFQLAPSEPGPPFFLGLAYVQSGDLAAAKQAWIRALALAPPDAPYRMVIAERLVVIDRFLALREARASPR